MVSLTIVLVVLGLFCVSQPTAQAAGDTLVIPNLSRLQTILPKFHSRSSSATGIQPRMSSELQVLEEFLFSPKVNPFASSKTCGTNLTNVPIGTFAFLTSPGYPKNYPPNLDCYWFLQGQQASTIRVVVFDLITQGWFKHFWDYLMISVSTEGEFTTYKRYAGDYTSNTPFILSTKKNMAQVVFHTSALFNFNGFKLAYLVTPSGPLKPPPLLGSWDTCGQAPIDTTKIIGGGNARPFSRPWMAFLLIDNTAACGGALISDRYVLTAAHCTVEAHFIIVMLGVYDLSDSGEYLKGRVAINTTTWYQHPDYDPTNLYNDITIVKLPTPIKFSDRIRPICLPSRWHLTETFEDLVATASGWGFTRTNGTVNRVLKSVDMKILPHSICSDIYPVRVTGNTLCVGGVPGESTCQGDSGGPLQLKQSNGAYILIGSVSYGGPSCEVGTPIVFTRTTAYLDFISMVTGLSVA